MYENTIRVARSHVSHACESMQLRERSMLVHLQIISAKSDKITESKLKLLNVSRAS